MQRDSLANTFLIAILLCVICSVIVSASAVGLKDTQEKNRELNKKENVLLAAGLVEEGQDLTADQVNELFQNIETKIVNLDTGDYTEAVNPQEYNHLEAAENPKQSKEVPKSEDIASILRREKYAPVYLIKNDAGELQQYVIPIRGYGLWSTLYGFLALDQDGKTIHGITFYKHGETPGLGGEVENPRWKAQWPGKVAYDEEGNPAIKVVKGGATEEAPHKVDAISGATITSNGVENLLTYWLGENGFGPYLKKQREQR